MSQRVNGSPADEVLVEDAHCTIRIDTRVPDVVRVDDDHWTMSTLIHAASVIDADNSLQPPISRPRFQGLVDFLRALRWAGLTRSTDEHVMSILAHSDGGGRMADGRLAYTKLPSGAS